MPGWLEPKRHGHRGGTLTAPTVTPMITPDPTSFFGEGLDESRMGASRGGDGLAVAVGPGEKRGGRAMELRGRPGCC